MSHPNSTYDPQNSYKYDKVDDMNEDVVGSGMTPEEKEIELIKMQEFEERFQD